MADIFERIKEEHRETDDMMHRLAQNYDPRLLERLSIGLTAHMEAEEQTLYPAMRDQERQLIDQAMEEHRQIKMALDQLDRNKGSQAFQGDLSKLILLVREHVSKEESEVLPSARDLFDENEVNDMSKRFKDLDNRIREKTR